MGGGLETRRVIRVCGAGELIVSSWDFTLYHVDFLSRTENIISPAEVFSLLFQLYWSGCYSSCPDLK